MSTCTIRSLRPSFSDAKTLIAIEHASLGDSDYTPTEALALIRRPEQHAYLADLDGEPAGFCACLETPCSSGWRLEIDMLGVLPAYRGQGIATALIEHSMTCGRLRGIRSFRAVVALENRASQRAFEKAGFSASRPVEMLVHELQGTSRWPHVPILPDGWTQRVWENGSCGHAGEEWSARGAGHEIHALLDETDQIMALAEALHVHTLAYVGLWIERLVAISEAVTRRMALLLVERAKELGCDEVGYLSPAETGQSEARLALLQEDYICVNRYLVLTL